MLSLTKLLLPYQQCVVWGLCDDSRGNPEALRLLGAHITTRNDLVAILLAVLDEAEGALVLRVSNMSR